MEPRLDGMKNSGGDSGLHGGIAEFKVFCFLNGFRCDGEYWIEPLRAGIGGGGPRDAAESDMVRLRLSLSCGGLILGGSVGGGEGGTSGRWGTAGNGPLSFVSTLSDLPLSANFGGGGLGESFDFGESGLTEAAGICGCCCCCCNAFDGMSCDATVDVSFAETTAVDWFSDRILFWCCINMGLRLSLPAAT